MATCRYRVLHAFALIIGLGFWLGGGCAGPDDGGTGGDGIFGGLFGGNQDGNQAGDGNGDGTGGGASIADLGFRPDPNGFNFPNYGNDDGPANLTAVEMRELFGDQVCASTAGGNCILTPVARKWMNEQNLAMDGGHCEGMAALSIMLFGGQLAVADLGAANAYAVANGPAVQRQIAKWFVTQMTEPTHSAEISGSAEAIIDRLRQAFQAGPAAESWTLGFYGDEGGHAVTPYRIDDRGGNLYAIAIYDNNFPGQELFVEADLNTNTWSYTTPTVPGAAPMVFSGTATSDTLSITPSSARLQPQQCPFGRQGSSQTAERGIWLDGKAHLQIVDDQGRRIGYFGGQLVNEIPGAAAVRLKTGTPHEPVYECPEGGGLTVTLDGSVLAGQEPSDVTMIGPGYTLFVDGVKLDPGQQDTITFSGTGSEVTYTTSTQETPVIGIGVTTDGPDWEFLISASGETNGQRIELHLDLANQRLAVQFSASDGSTDYGIAVQRTDENGEQEFTHSGNSAADGATVYLEYGQWQGEGKPMKLATDAASDGSVDSEVEIADQQ